jgi:L-threonylcarbamoyladenylate synthase
MGQSGLAEVLSTHTRALFQQAVVRAAELLRAGQVVALPTETVYGLAANALDPGAVARIFEIKGRPAYNPVIVHVSDLTMARSCVREWPRLAGDLAAAFWPGPLTMVLPRSELIPAIVAAGGPTVGVRWPAHPFMRAVIELCGFPVAAPSANLSNEISPTAAEHVRKTLGAKIGLVVDGGQSQVGIESTVLDLTVQPPRILRPGMIHLESLLAVTRDLGWPGAADGAQLKSPGLLPKHYSPKAKLWLWGWTDERELRQKLETRNQDPSTVHVISHTNVPLGPGFGSVSVIPHDPEAFARAIYAELHRCDDQGARLIVVEAVPDTPAWHAITDRLKRAATP